MFRNDDCMCNYSNIDNTTSLNLIVLPLSPSFWFPASTLMRCGVVVLRRPVCTWISSRTNDIAEQLGRLEKEQVVLNKLQVAYTNELHRVQVCMCVCACVVCARACIAICRFNAEMHMSPLCCFDVRIAGRRKTIAPTIGASGSHLHHLLLLGLLGDLTLNATSIIPTFWHPVSAGRN
jgi:hypothetical protein